MLEDLLRWLAESEGVLAYLVLALFAALEYVVPPLPGDTITLFGTFLAATAGYQVVWVYVCLTGGSIGGSLVAYAFGLWVGRHEERWPRFLRGERTRRAVRGAIERFDRHGGAYLVVNRFLPALRAVFFVAAGMAELPLWKVVLFGGLSAALWTGLILAVGWTVGDNWEALHDLSVQYTWWSLAAVGLVVVVLVARSAARRRAR